MTVTSTLRILAAGIAIAVFSAMAALAIGGGLAYVITWSNS